MGRQLRPLAQPRHAPLAPAQSAIDGTVVLTPRAVEVAAPATAPARRKAGRKPRVQRSAVYVAYRRRSASGAIRVATGLAEQPGR